MAAALNSTGRPIAFSCSWPAYEGGLPPKVSHSVYYGFPLPGPLTSYVPGLWELLNNGYSVAVAALIIVSQHTHV